MADPKQITSILNLSDEEIMNLDPATLSAAPAQPDASAEAGAGESDEEKAAREAEEQAAAQAAEAQRMEEEAAAAAANNQGGDNGDDQGTAQGAPNGAEAGQGGDGKTDPADDAGDGAKAPAGKDQKDAAGKPADPKPAGTPPAANAAGTPDELTQLKDFQSKILGKFKAAGREMQVRDADEALQLMQMGVGYNKRMAELKPNLGIIESLRKADLLDQGKVDFLIDLMAKKPEAISKLVKDSGIDPLDITAEKAGDYKPTSYKVAPEELELDAVWAELESTDGFDRTAMVVAKEWDPASQATILQHPQLLRIINAQVQSGVYDQVAAEVHRERVLGRLTGLSDLEAYRQVGDAMEAAGKFKPQESVAGQPATPGKGTPAVPAVVKPDPKQAEDSNRNGQRRAASPARATPAPAKTTVNFLALSDEDIMSGKFG